MTLRASVRRNVAAPRVILRMDSVKGCAHGQSPHYRRISAKVNHHQKFLGPAICASQRGACIRDLPKSNIGVDEADSPRNSEHRGSRAVRDVFPGHRSSPRPRPRRVPSRRRALEGQNPDIKRIQFNGNHLRTLYERFGSPARPPSTGSTPSRPAAPDRLVDGKISPL